MSSHLNYAIKNVFWGYIGTFVTALLNFISRTVFIYSISADYLGINGLFASVLGVLSLSELGFGMAMGYSLYRPAAENDIEKIKSLMKLYRTAYRVIAVTVALLGISILPFLHYIIKGGEGIEHIKIYYLIFLFNTVSSYFVSYKYSFLNAQQQSYIVNNLTTVFNIIMVSGQIIVLVIYKSYIAYLLVQMLVQLLMKIYSSVYIDKMYPFLNDKNVKPLDVEEKKKIQTNIKALIIHKIGEISVYQSDNIIISSFINIATVGLVSNYVLITGFFNTFINVFFNSLTGTIGNYLAGSTPDDQRKLFQLLDFAGFILFSFSAVCIYALIQPFILILWGKDYVLTTGFLSVYLFNFFITGQRMAIQQVKIAGGVFVQDKFLPLAQSFVNVFASIILVQFWGINGVFAGTVIAGLLPSLVRPYIVFKHLFKCSPVNYYIEYAIRLCITTASGFICFMLTRIIFKQTEWYYLIFSAFAVILFAAFVLFLYACTKQEAQYFKEIFFILLENLIIF